MAGGIVGVNEDDGTRGRCDGAAKTFRIHLPAVVVDEGREGEADVVESGEEVEERIAGLGDENFRARVAEEAERGSCRLRWCWW